MHASLIMAKQFAAGLSYRVAAGDLTFFCTSYKVSRFWLWSQMMAAMGQKRTSRSIAMRVRFNPESRHCAIKLRESAYSQKQTLWAALATYTLR